MPNVFATAGGYMQMLNTFFSLLSIIPNKFFYDNIIINNLFDYNIKKNKIIIKNKKCNNSKKNKKYINDLDNFIKEQEKNRNNITLKLKDKNENVNLLKYFYPLDIYLK